MWCPRLDLTGFNERGKRKVGTRSRKIQRERNEGRE